MRIVLGALIIAGALLGAFVGTPLNIAWAGLIYLGLPVGLALVFVVSRRYRPSKAALLGGLTAAGVIIAVIYPALFVSFLLGDLATDADCDGFCHGNAAGLILGLLLMPLWTVPVAITGGIVSAVASYVGVRPARTA
jgi:hypothetical protein